MNLEYGAKPDKQSFSCHSYLSEDKYHTKANQANGSAVKPRSQTWYPVAELRHETQSVSLIDSEAESVSDSDSEWVWSAESTK